MRAMGVAMSEGVSARARVDGVRREMSEWIASVDARAEAYQQELDAEHGAHAEMWAGWRRERERWWQVWYPISHRGIQFIQRVGAMEADWMQYARNGAAAAAKQYARAVTVDQWLATYIDAKEPAERSLGYCEGSAARAATIREAGAAQMQELREVFTNWLRSPEGQARLADAVLRQGAYRLVDPRLLPRGPEDYAVEPLPRARME
jgi:hypothetical protein